MQNEQVNGYEAQLLGNLVNLDVAPPLFPPITSSQVFSQQSPPGLRTLDASFKPPP